MQKQQPAVGRHARKRIMVTGPAAERQANMGTSDHLRLGMTEDGPELLHDEDTFLAYCIAGREVLHSPADIKAVCVVCGGLLCETCAKVVCSDENCLKPVCPADRQRINGDDEPGQYLCRPHHEEWLRERMLIGIALAVAAAVVTLVVFFWLR